MKIQKLFLTSLRNKGIKLAALSNTIPQHVEVMENEGVFDLFDVRVLSCEAGLRKPDPRIYKLTLEKLGVLPKQVFFTDDRKENVEAAEKLGINAFLFESTSKLRKDLNKIGLVI